MGETAKSANLYFKDKGQVNASHVKLALGVSSHIKAIGLLWQNIKAKYVKRKCSHTCNFTANLVAAELPLILV